MDISSHISEEEFQRWLEANKNNPSTLWSHQIAYTKDWLADMEKPDIPLEQDENGTYGYKVLLRIPREGQWLFSPTKFFNGEWVENRLTAHEKPHPNTYAGIYATKTIEELEPWFNHYARNLTGIGICVAVKIRVWGIVVEHSRGFRAEYAEIVRAYGYW